MRRFFISCFFLISFICINGVFAQPYQGGIKVSYFFQKNNFPDCEIALTKDSVGLMPSDTTDDPLAMGNDLDFSSAVKKRALSMGEKDSAEQFIRLSKTWKGIKRFACDNQDGYAFSFWSDSLDLHCNNCFSCSDGMGMQDARILARFGKMSIWLYKLRENWGRPSETRAAESRPSDMRTQSAAASEP